ncbi:MAG: GatB/YqeY domain-containing protein [Deltaproteobacteria bacterium]|nr:GatB/YqeY domain-containing protein [Deltaproteobacteria bacterium]
MELYEQIKSDFLTARKNNDNTKKNILTMILSDALKLTKEKNHGNTVNDDDIIKIIKSWIKKTEQSIEILTANNKDISEPSKEKEILLSYIPKTWSYEETTSYIEQIAKEKNSKEISVIMRELKINYSGLYDNKTASEIIKSL